MESVYFQGDEKVEEGAFLFQTSRSEGKTPSEGLPGGTVDGSPPPSAEDIGLIPSMGRFHILQSTWAHVPRLLSLCTTATEAHTP